MIEEVQVIGGWAIRCVWSDESHLPVEIHVTPAEGAENLTNARGQRVHQQGISSTVLREVKLARPQSSGRAVGDAIRELNEAVEALQAFTAGGRGSITEDYLRALARAYKACGPAHTTTSVKMLAEATGRNGKTVMNHLTKARKLGYLG
ncbi:hypothetical protein DN069_32045 [Streptacidiphilus pinicola]|uniref:Uncharacterized protein n=1 Tax=Streptacidiphilus pinicola TaxID=2219663 RepID=A0A2X0K2Q5_9ACTN|nr:hypothetical protein [Streptacidiphilus pinicola]RAG81590.1 hypothetical protein DN069_32045 [Streptacidiphilus pinicola]